MNCIGPLAPEDYELLAYADGQATPEAAVHISACPSCQARAEALQQEWAMWQTMLHRAGCPSGQELGEHYLRMLPPKRAAEISEHLQYCRACASEIGTLAAFLGQAEISRVETTLAQTMDALRTLKAQLGGLGSKPSAGFAAPAPQSAPALREVRGPYIDDTPPVTYNAENFLVTLEFFPETGAPTRQVIGMVIGLDDFAGAEVEIMDGDGAPHRSAIDELGSFSLTGVSVGSHQIRVKLPASGVQMEIDDFIVK